MFTNLSTFTEQWEYEALATQKMLDSLTDASLSQEVTSADRTLGRIVWHTVLSVHEMMNRAGLEFPAPGDENHTPDSAKTIADAHTKVCQDFIQALNSQWTDESLQEELNMYGEKWKKGLVLVILTKHLIHHRGQMTILMRQAGLKVPGVFGPSREEWAAMGFEQPPSV
jgi:uncharacterized damage-inducible protein DinB